MRTNCVSADVCVRERDSLSQLIDVVVLPLELLVASNVDLNVAPEAKHHDL